MERIGLAAAVDRRCPRQGGLSEGVVLTVLVVNRLLAPCALAFRLLEVWRNLRLSAHRIQEMQDARLQIRFAPP